MPQSATCATATISVTFNSPTASTFTIPADTPFNTVISGKTYTFYTTSTSVSPTPLTSYTFTGITIKEKSNNLAYNFTVADGARYIIPNANVDLSTLTVQVQDTAGSSTITTYTPATTIVDTNSSSTVYWIKEIDNGLYELVFGNGIIGTALATGNTILTTYAVSSLDAPNGAKVFSYGGTTPSGGSVYVTTTSVASGGSTSENIDSIKFNAPRAYSAQNRGVTPSDYKAIIYSNFLTAQSVAVWGGEHNVPPIYGKVFICVKPIGTDVLTTAEKNTITNILLERNTLTIQPVIVDPEYIKLIVHTTVYYNELLTTRTQDTIASVVTDTILNYDSTDLQTFDGVFKYSKLSKLIDACENSIVSNITTVTIKRDLLPKYNINAKYTINLLNPIYFSGAAEDIILSTGFYISGSTAIHYLVDDGLNNMMMFTFDSNNNRVIENAVIGNVDYTMGIIQINNINITSLVGSTFTFYIKPQSNDVVSTLTQIVEIDTSELIVNVVSDKTSTGNNVGGTNYVFTSSRI